MHEMSIALGLLDVAEEEAGPRGWRVAALHLKLGPLSGVVPAALVSAYELAREGTSLASANLVIEEVPVSAYCPACSAERSPAQWWDLVCPTCGSAMPEVLHGQELDLVALEIEP
jgi:hydrogenase nickel incorporation protein HypA/HybF